MDPWAARAHRHLLPKSPYLSFPFLADGRSPDTSSAFNARVGKRPDAYGLQSGKPRPRQFSASSPLPVLALPEPSGRGYRASPIYRRSFVLPFPLLLAILSLLRYRGCVPCFTPDPTGVRGLSEFFHSRFQRINGEPKPALRSSFTEQLSSALKKKLLAWGNTAQEQQELTFGLYTSCRCCIPTPTRHYTPETTRLLQNYPDFFFPVIQGDDSQPIGWHRRSDMGLFSD